MFSEVLLEKSTMLLFFTVTNNLESERETCQKLNDYIYMYMYM